MIMMISSGVVTVNSAQAARKTALTIAFTVIKLRKPKARMTRAASAFMPMAPSEEPKVTRPEWNGDSPKPICINSGSRKGRAPMPSRNRKPPSTAARSVGRFRSESPAPAIPSAGHG